MTLSEYLQAKRELVEAATPGPWEFERICHDEGSFSYEMNEDDRFLALYENDFSPMKAKFNSDFIADARTTMPKLLAALESALGALEAITQERSHCIRCDSRDALAEEAKGRIERILEVKP